MRVTARTTSGHPALAEQREPATSGRDNVESIKLAFAAVEASQTGRAVDLGAAGKA